MIFKVMRDTQERRKMIAAHVNNYQAGAFGFNQQTTSFFGLRKLLEDTAAAE